MTSIVERPPLDYVDDVVLYELSPVELVFTCVLYALISILAVVGNSLTIYVTLRRLRTKSITTYFIINLALADILTGLLAIPFKFQAALFQEWFLPRSLCQIVPFTETVSLSVSVFTLTASAIHEFRTTFFPKTSNRWSSKNAQLLVVTIWIVAGIVSLPHGLFHDVYVMEDTETNSTIAQCRPVYADADWWKVYNIYLTIIQYFVPMIIIDTAYTMIGIKIWTSTTPSTAGPRPLEQGNRRLVNMLVIVVACFSLCWLPLETYLLLNEIKPEINGWKYINVFFFCSHWLAMSNSCLNPIIYGLFNEKYQREYKRVFCRKSDEDSDNKSSPGYQSIAERSWNLDDVDDLEGTPMKSAYKTMCGAGLQMVEAGAPVPTYL